MNTQENFDNIFRNKLEGAEQTPPPEVWDNISSHLKKNNNRPWLPLLFTILAALLILGGIFFLYPENASLHKNMTGNSAQLLSENEHTSGQIEHSPQLQSETPSSEDRIASMTEKSNNTHPKVKAQHTQAENLPSHENINDVSASANALTDGSISTSDIKQSPALHSTESSPSDILQQTTRRESISDTPTSSSDSPSRTLDGLVKEVNIQTSAGNLSPQIENSMINSGGIIKSHGKTASSTVFTSEKEQFTENLMNSSSDSQGQSSEPTDTYINNIPDFNASTSSMQSLAYLPALSPEQLIAHSKTNSIPSLGDGIIDLKKNHFSLFAEARIGIGYGNRYLTLNDPLYSSLYKNKKQLESGTYNQSAAVYIGALWDKGLSLRTGIELFRQWEKYRYIDPYARIDKPLIEYDTTYIGGQQQVSIDTISDYTIGIQTHQHYNKISSLDIPLIIGYEKPIGNWILSINGGIFLNVLQAVQGEMAGMNKTPVTVGEDALPYSYKTHVGMGFYGGIGLSYYLKNGWEVGIFPRIRYNPSSIITDNSVLLQKYLQFNLNLAVRKYL